MLKTDPDIQALLDSLYRKLLDAKSITRFCNSDMTRNPEHLILDKKCHIDVLITTANNMTFSIQEKVRDPFYLSYDEFTLEYFNDPKTGEKGEWFELIAELYAYVYAKNKEILKGYIFWMAPLKMAILQKKIVPSALPIPNSAYGRATFIPFRFADFEPQWFLWKGENYRLS